MKKKYKINSKRLNRIITSRECKSALDNNLYMYSCLSPIQRNIIKEMLNRNRV